MKYSEDKPLNHFLFCVVLFLCSGPPCNTDIVQPWYDEKEIFPYNPRLNYAYIFCHKCTALHTVLNRTRLAKLCAWLIKYGVIWKSCRREWRSGCGGFVHFRRRVIYPVRYASVVLHCYLNQIVDQHMLADGVLWISVIKLEENINSCVVCFLLDLPILLVFCPFS